MKRQAFMIELLEDCVFSARAATEGAHESLDRIPGGALLGAAASRLYARLGRRDAYTAFHSGKLRFGDGLPWHGNRIGWPLPLCWHHAKTQAPARNGRLDGDKIFNFLHCDNLGDHRQPKQMRGGYVHSDGRFSKPAHSLRLKTAIDPDTGRADEGRLFGYDALHQGQRFVSFLEADDDVNTNLWHQVIDALSGDILLGRSRAAEYGSCRTEHIELDPPRNGATNDTQLVLWLLSDLAPTDKAGQPTLTLDGDALHLPGAQIDWKRTFIRTRRYSPWNAARHGYDRERLVIVAGSVITLRLQAPLNDDQRQRLQQGIGLHREAGLGRVWINPPLLDGVHPHFESTAPMPAPSEPARPDHPLIGWLESRDTAWKEKAEDEAKSLEQAIREAIGRARRFAGVDPALPFGPSKSQWGTVMHRAKNTPKAKDLFKALFEGDSAVIKSHGEGWNIEIPPKQTEEWQSLAEWLKTVLAIGNDSDRHYLHKVRVLARCMQDDQGRRRV